MAILIENWKELIKPSTVSVEYSDEKKKKAAVTVGPLERGFGVTLGNALRRVMLSSIRGFAVTSIKIDGVLHEYSVIKGVREDVTDIVMNIKSLIIKKGTSKPSVMRLKVNKKGCVTAGDIVAEGDAEIVNKDLVICNIEKDGVEINMEMLVENGSGYRSVEEVDKKEKPLGTILLDAVFSPVKRVGYTVKNARVGQKTDYDKLILDVVTNGTLNPEEAVGLAAKIIQDQLSVFIGFDIPEDTGYEAKKAEKKVNTNLFKKIDEMELSVRSYNCLKNENIVYIGDLVSKTEGEMLKMQNFGRKSLNELKDNLKGMDLTFGMKLENWPPKNIEELSKKSSKIF